MAYQVLARRWRPRTFQAVLGQEHVLMPLISALDHKRLHHAYLFSGTRGVGKTTLGRLLAKSLNCEQGVSSQPCGQCSICQETDAGCCVDLIEVDAASRTKVEDTRELLDNVQYRPVRSRYKIYLIDEVHMLSRHSFNALLKTLEEPPEHVKFIFATTEASKLPATVTSRCLHFHLKSLKIDTIVQQLEQIVQAENKQVQPEALHLLAQTADGSMRDALSLLEQVLTGSSECLTATMVAQMLGCLDTTHLYQLLTLIARQDASSAVEKIGEIATIGPDFDGIHADLERLLHEIALSQLLVESNVEPQTPVQRLAQEMTPEDVQLFYQIALNGRRDLPYAPDFKSGFEMTVLRMLAFHPAKPAPHSKDKPSSTTAMVTQKTPEEKVQKVVACEARKPAEEPRVKVKTAEHKATGSEDDAHQLQQKNELDDDAFMERIIQRRQQLLSGNKASPDVVRKTDNLKENEPKRCEPLRNIDHSSTKMDWESWINAAQLRGMLRQIALDATLEYVQQEAHISIPPKYHKSLTSEHQNNMRHALQGVQSQVDIRFVFIQEPQIQTTPRHAQQQRQHLEKQALQQRVNNDEKLNNLLSTFDGQLQPDTLKSVLDGDE